MVPKRNAEYEGESGEQSPEDFEKFPRKNPRGRPRKERPEGEAETVTVSVEETEPRIRGKKADSAVSILETKLSDSDAAAGTAMALMMLNSFAITLAGSEAAIQPQEKALIETGLKRTLKRVTPSQMERFGAILDPLMIAAGLGIWYRRILVLPDKAKQKLQRDAQESSGIQNAEPQASNNGQETVKPIPNEPATVVSTPIPDAIRNAVTDI